MTDKDPTGDVGEDPELYVVNFSDAAGAEEYRRRRERSRSIARGRYHDYLAAMFGLHSSDDPGALADAALDAVSLWLHVDSGEPCSCSCHPRLPESDFHDYGFGCSCTRTAQERRLAWDNWRNEATAFWQSPEGKRIRAAERAAEAELETWLATQPRVAVYSHGGLAPEQWRGIVDDHTFYFRERHDEWRIELDLRPNGRFARALVGTCADGQPRYETRELSEGEVIAQGTIDVNGYGTNPVGRVNFIVDTIRVHLARRACNLHVQDLSSIAVLLGCEVRWCPACGTRLSTY
ncbi:hypothetical protein [Mycobacterium sp. 29Ha]|uniref:hypothetical protein n=1 Tax=Mycobacterium sp. 29Ha TaxID=2939268 RepID=UPI002938E72F|nr:hypothetical protein [Mycobacterium sp. 29Ha]MDV3136391.1 hypothetical protein [Mycobacterium sp. 29Ha]